MEPTPIVPTINGTNYSRVLDEQLQATSLAKLPRDLVPAVISYLRPLMRPPLKENYQPKFSFGGPGSGQAQFNYPFAIAICEDGTILAADCYNGVFFPFGPN
jgi:hypothetical protein